MVPVSSTFWLLHSKQSCIFSASGIICCALLIRNSVLLHIRDPVTPVLCILQNRVTNTAKFCQLRVSPGHRLPQLVWSLCALPASLGKHSAGSPLIGIPSSVVLCLGKSAFWHLQPWMGSLAWKAPFLLAWWGVRSLLVCSHCSCFLPCPPGCNFKLAQGPFLTSSLLLHFGAFHCKPGQEQWEPTLPPLVCSPSW